MRPGPGLNNNPISPAHPLCVSNDAKYPYPNSVKSPNLRKFVRATENIVKDNAIKKKAIGFFLFCFKEKIR